MNIGVIKKKICVNAISADMETAKRFLSKGALGDADTVAELPDGYGINDLYANGAWSHPPKEEPEQPVTDDTADSDYISEGEALNILLGGII